MHLSIRSLYLRSVSVTSPLLNPSQISPPFPPLPTPLKISITQDHFILACALMYVSFPM